LPRGLLHRWLISRYDYHFIHIPKNAGRAMRRVMRRRRDVSMTKPYHYRYRDLSSELQQRRCFAVVRNPWSRTASRYMFGRENAVRWADDDPRRLYILAADFERFVREQPVFSIPEHPGQPWMGPLASWFNQTEWLCDQEGRVASDCLRLERLNDDASAYFNCRVTVPREGQTKSKYDYRRMYTDELAEIVAKTFQADIDYFGFTFEGTATRNTFAG
jgi:hypothetical protein